MSEQETRRGVMKLLPRENGVSLDEQIEDLLVNVCGIKKFPNYCECWYEKFIELPYYSNVNDRYIIVGDKIYELLENEKIDYDYCNIKKIGDEYHFDTSWYNGGGSFEEMLQHGLEKLRNDEK